MARMLPPYCSAEVRSTGEREVFDLLKYDPDTADWVCLHSLGLARHVRQVYGEIDFLVLVPGEGVFCLEVKAGRVSRNAGVWRFTNRYGEFNTSTKGPFRQAQDGMFSLREAVRRRFGEHHRLSQIAYGYGVLFPHIIWEHSEPEYEDWRIYDADSRRRPISAFIQELSQGTHQSLQRHAWYDSSRARPTSEDIEELVSFLRGDFEMVVRPGQQLAAVEQDLLRLTQEQYRCLDGLQDNNRCLFEGGAGTGKTLLAIEFARREWHAGRRVLLLCFNRLLGRWLTDEMSDMAAAGNKPVTAGTLHHILDDAISRSARQPDFVRLRSARRSIPEQRTFFQEAYPRLALEAIAEGAVEPFDVLVVDEGQDLIRPGYLDVMDALLKGGLPGGRWAIFCDFYRQAIYADVSAKDMLDEIDRRAPRYARYRLSVNCRNTKPVGEETALMSGFDTPPFLPSQVEGVPVEYRFFPDGDGQRKTVCQIINVLLRQGISSEQITILSPLSRQNSCLAQPLEDAGCSIQDLTDSARLSPRTVGFSTIQAFKGMENSVVIIADVDHIQDDRHRSLLYVGMSRARHRLFVLLAESAREEYSAAIQRKLEKRLRQP
jgi:nuclease-like protein/UvrD-like helicase family protein